MKKLPLGIQTFSKIIEDGCLYVDKTKEILNLITEGDYFFLSRPRRFGKSLLVSTLKEIFSGNKELFSGLYIYDKIAWESHPVIHIDFTLFDYCTVNELNDSLLSLLDTINEDYKLNIRRKGISVYFQTIVKELCNKYNKVVILIDEYDKPIIDYITDVKKASGNREVLSKFYSVLKGSDEYIKFVFITGVSKFSKASIFSGLNNLKDITLSPKYAVIAGYTQEELEIYFKEHIEILSREEGIEREDMLEKIRFWYDGYSWNGKDHLYNPFSILNLFSDNLFNNYWFTSGTTGFLINIIKNSRIQIERYENIKVGGEVFDSYDIDNLEINSLLFQTGYLTIQSIERKKNRCIYELTYPNFEVKTSLLNHLTIAYLAREDKEISTVIENLENRLSEDDTEAFIQIIRSVFAGIPYTLHLPHESYYHSLFYMILTLMGLKLDLEVLTDRGRVDGVYETEDKIYVIEFKYGKEGSDMNKLLDKAINQIRERKYYERFQGVHSQIVDL